MSNFNRFNCLLFVPLDDDKRVSVRLLRSGAAVRLTTIQQLRRFFFRVFKYRLPCRLFLINCNYFVVHDNVAQRFYLCRFVLDAGAVVVESFRSSFLLRLSLGILLDKYLYFSTYDSRFLNWDDLLKYLYQHYYTGRFDFDFFTRMNAPDIVFHLENMSI